MTTPRRRPGHSTANTRAFLADMVAQCQRPESAQGAPEKDASSAEEVHIHFHVSSVEQIQHLLSQIRTH